MVKKLRRQAARALGGIAIAFAVAGCAVHLNGFVRPLAEGSGTSLTTMEGVEYRLALGPDSQPLAFLDGHMVGIDGKKAGGRVHVTDWEVLEGLHGLQVWVGPVDILGIQVGLTDRATGSYFVLDEASWDVLAPFAGDTVLVEGWVEGAHRLKVVYYRVLAAEDPSPGGAP